MDALRTDCTHTVDTSEPIHFSPTFSTTRSLPRSQPLAISPPVSGSDTLDPSNPLEARFLRDTAIRGLLNDLVNNLNPREVAVFRKQVARQGKSEKANEPFIASFSSELSRIFSELENLGVQAVSLPAGRQHFSECTPVEWVGIYTQLLSQRQALDQGTYPMDGVVPLSVRPHPSWSFHSQDIRNSTLLDLFMEVTTIVNSAMPEDFSNLARIFSELDSLGVHLLSPPKGQKNFSKCTSDEWRELFSKLSALRAELSYRVDELTQKLSQHGGPVHQSYELSDFVGAETPMYRPRDLALSVPDGVFQEQIGRMFGTDSMLFRWAQATETWIHPTETWIAPTPEHARDYTGALVANVLPGLRRAVAHHTSRKSAQAYDLVSRSHNLGRARTLIDAMYTTHDAALGILGELDALVGGDQRNVQFVLDEITSRLKEFRDLK